MDGRPKDLSKDHYKNFTQFSSTQQNHVREALAHYEDVSNVRFQEKSSGGTVQIGYADVFYDFNGDGKIEYEERAGGLATRPTSSGSRLVMSRTSTDFSPGGWGYSVVLHELGHAALIGTSQCFL